MATLIPNRYQLDLTGVNPNNAVAGEVHNPAVKMIRSISPIYGPFFVESMQVYDINTNVKLTKNVDYDCVDVISIPTAQTGKEICSIVLLTNKLVSGVRLEYQTLGGGYEKEYSAIRLLIENLVNDKRSVAWPDITNRPYEFQSNMHLHKLGDVIGFEYLIAEIEQLKMAILLGDELNHQEIFQYIDSRFALFSDANKVDILVALAKASRANTGATKALADITAIDDKVNLGVELMGLALLNSERLANNMTNSALKAKALMDSYSSLFPNP